MKITYIGHATVLIESTHGNILTDPWFTQGPHLLRRKRMPALDPSQLPGIDYILLSHEHFDHFDPRSLITLSGHSTVIVHRGLGNKVKHFGFEHVKELFPWESFANSFLEITAVPASHSRYSLGFVISYEKTIYFAGDTTLIPKDFQKIGRDFSVDLAILPIGGVKVLGLQKKVMNPEDALKAIELINPAKVLPVHWGTFKKRSLLMWMTGMPEQLQDLVKREKLTAEILHLEEGGSVVI